MKHEIKNTTTLKKLLWLDFFLGCTTAVVGLIFFDRLMTFLGLATRLIITISAITLVYSIAALILATQKNTSIPLLRALIFANWLWSGISVALAFFHLEQATALGQAFLILQILVVGALAYLEGLQVIRKSI
jgi:hypothetical protein